MKSIFTCLLLLFTFFVSAQKDDKEDKIYLFDTNWNAAKTSNASFIVADKLVNDTTLTRRVYHYKGSLIREETYRGAGADILHGYLAFFGDDGKIDSSGYVWEGKKDSTWLVYDDTLAAVLKKEYYRGKLLKETDLVEQRKLDKLNGYDTVGKEAYFKGGVKAWIKYLTKHYNYPDRAMALKIGGMVKILFIVNSDGTVIKPRILQSVEYTIDKEALRLIMNSPKWEPAEKDGRKLKAYRIQPITFASPG